MSELNTVLAHIDANREAYLKQLCDYLSMPSRAVVDGECERCAELARTMLEEAGISARVMPTDGRPVVYGELRSPVQGAKTLLFYGHYDVQPPEPLDAWVSPPFSPTVRDGKLYARGVVDNKAQHLAHVLAVNSYIKTQGSLPLNVKFILEGEEETGSPSLPKFVERNKELLAADLVYISDGSEHESRRPIICFGNRGIVIFSITVATAGKDNHSGRAGGVIANAGYELARLLSSIVDADGNILVEGYYDNAVMPTPFEYELIDRLPFDLEDIRSTFAAECTAADKRAYYLNTMYRPTITVNAIECGDPAVIKTSLPGRAMARFDSRLVGKQTPDEAYDKVVAHVKKQNIKGTVTVERSGAYMLPAKSDPGDPMCRRIIDIVAEEWEKEPVIIPVMGGGLPNFVWSDTLGTNFVTVPYGNTDSTNHAPNENMTVEYFYKGIRTTARVIAELAKL